MQEKKMWLVSALCAGVCAVCVLLYLLSVRGEVDKVRTEALERYGGDQLEVCVATRDLVAGETLSSSDVETKLWVAALLPEGAVTHKSEIVGSMVSSTILAGEVVSDRRLGGEDDALEVPEGLTAVSVPAKSVQAVGGAISPGQKVDLYSTGTTTTALIGSNLLVLATSASSGAKTNAEISWITLAVQPQSVQELVKAAQSATLYFALPGQGAELAGALAASSSPTEGGVSGNKVVVAG